MTSEHSGGAQLFVNISSEWNTTWPIVVYIPSYAAVAKYTKVRHDIFWKTTGTSKSSGMRENRKDRYGWLYRERKGKSFTLVE